MKILDSMREGTRRIRRDSVTLWFASRHPDTPLLPKVICILAAAYALSPIDLIPDFIPVLGHLDDLILVPALIWLALRLMPPPVVASCRVKADGWMAKHGPAPRSLGGAVVIVGIWVMMLGLLCHWLANAR